VCVSGMGCQVCMMHTLKPSARPSSPLVGRAGLGLRDTPNVAGVTTANAAPCNRPAIHTFIFIKTSHAYRGKLRQVGKAVQAWNTSI
jgi:hypothetical protein